RWSALQFDTTAYDWTTAGATAGAYEFKGSLGKCMDVGGGTHPEHSAALYYDCNGTLAQFFAIKLVDEHLGYYNITAFSRCLDISGSTPSAGATIELNTCSGSLSQQFAFDNFDRRYIYLEITLELGTG